MKKYEFTGETKTVQIFNKEITLHRIRAAMNFKNISTGDLGGWIEDEKNLSQKGNAWVYGNARIHDDAQIYGNAQVYSGAWVSRNAQVFSENHVLIIGAIGSRNAFTTFYRGKGNRIMVKCGCFNDTIDKFLQKVKQTHGENRHAKVYRMVTEAAKMQIDLSDETSAESEVE